MSTKHDIREKKKKKKQPTTALTILTNKTKHFTHSDEDFVPLPPSKKW